MFSLVYRHVNEDRDQIQDDFNTLEQRLRDERPVPTDGELGRVRARATSTRAGSGTRAARLAMVSLVSGTLLIGGSGAALAVSGGSGDGAAGAAQYRQNVPTQTSPLTPSDIGGVAPGNDTGTAPSTEEDCDPSAAGARSAQTGNVCPDSDFAPGEETGARDPAQTVRQASSGGSDGRLPFTGLAAIPLLALGVLMLAGGLVLRRRDASEPS